VDKTKEIDLELFKNVQAGDEQAFTVIFNTYYEPLYRFAARFVREAEIAEGIVQEVFVKIWINKNKINIVYNVKTYLYTTVKNHCLNFIKQNKRISSLDEITEKRLININSPEEVYERNEKLKAINKAIERLPNRRKQIFLMKKYNELSYKEIAEILNISLNTVKTQMKRALKSLIKQLNHLRMIAFFSL
jgi:RNA polymerase sigma-70 factor (ECF subfamily)